MCYCHNLLKLNWWYFAIELRHPLKSQTTSPKDVPRKGKVSVFLKETSELIKNHIRRCQGIYFKAQEGSSFSGEASFSEDKPVFIIPFFIKVCFNLNILSMLQTHLYRESTVLITFCSLPVLPKQF